MKINKPEIIKEKDHITYKVLIENELGNNILWYNIDKTFGDLLSNTADAPLVALILPAMELGEDIHIDGKVSEKLLYNLTGPFQKLLQKIIPSLHQIKIYPSEIYTEEKAPKLSVAMGFSGGVDSYSALADFYYTNTLKGLKVTHLLFNNVGSHGRGGEQLFRKRYEQLKPAVGHLKLPLLLINSNLDAFYSKKLHFEQTHTLRNASVAHLLKGGIGHFMYASTFSYADLFVGQSGDTAYCDPFILPILSTNSIDVFSIGSEYSRVEKTLSVAQLPDSYKALDVCANPNNTSGFINCSACWKCLRTMATLEIADRLDLYNLVFNIDTYHMTYLQDFV